jgi:hypothetical protein
MVRFPAQRMGSVEPLEARFGIDEHLTLPYPVAVYPSAERAAGARGAGLPRQARAPSDMTNAIRRFEAREESRHVTSREAREASVHEHDGGRHDGAAGDGAFHGEDLHDRASHDRVARDDGSQRLPLGAYDEGEDVVTSFFELPPSEPSWLVQVTPFDRRSMSSSQLRFELRRGSVVNGETLVWRRGMKNWSQAAHIVAQLLDVGAHEWFALAPRVPPTLRSRAKLEPTPGANATALVASSVACVLCALLTLALIAWGGAFEPGRHPDRSIISVTQSISPRHHARESVPSQSLTRPSDTPPDN